MNAQELNLAINEFVKENLSPLEKERNLIENRYDDLKKTLSGHTFRSGSYARYTAIHPVHDLDVINEYTELQFEDIPKLMRELAVMLVEHYGDNATVTEQSHSVAAVFPDEFSIDIVPGLRLDGESNEFGEPLYLVPDIQKMSHSARAAKYEARDQIDSKKSDPRGYRKQAQDLNEANPDFRHSVKLVKGWRHGCRKRLDNKFKLKAFHAELIVTQYFTGNPKATSQDAIQSFFENLPSFLTKAQIPDRASVDVMVDEYVNDLTAQDKEVLNSEIKIAATKIVGLESLNSNEDVHQSLSEVCGLDQKKSTGGPTGYVRPTGAWAE